MSDRRAEKTTLDNGLLVVLKEMHHAPVASFWVWYRVGSRNETPGITGISHWVEHMLFKGTPTFPQGEFDKAVAREGGVFNGMTSIDWTTYFETLPSDRLDLGLRIEADRMTNSLFCAQELAKERTVVISERERAENSPRWLLGEEVQAAAFRAHPYRHQVVGWKHDLQSMTRDDLWQYYRAYYAPNNAIAVATGDFESDTMLARIEELFGDAALGPELLAVRAVEPPQRGERRVVVEGEGKTAYLQMVFHAVSATHEDYFPLVVLDTVLGGAKPMSFFGGGTTNRSSRLYKALVDTELAAGAGSSVQSTVDPFLFSFSATLRPERTLEEVETALWTELERVASEPITPEELSKAIKQTRAQFAYSSESVSNQGFWLGFSEIVASTEWFDGYLDSLAAVTAEDVQQVAQKYLARSKGTVGCYVPQG